MKIEERAIADVTNFRDSCKRAAKRMGWDLKDTSYAVWDFTLSALEKQVPKEPVDATAGHEYIYGELPRWDCPICGEELAQNFKHCPECGQAMDWKVGGRP